MNATGQNGSKYPSWIRAAIWNKAAETNTEAGTPTINCFVKRKTTSETPTEIAIKIAIASATQGPLNVK